MLRDDCGAHIFYYIAVLDSTRLLRLMPLVVVPSTLSNTLKPRNFDDQALFGDVQIGKFTY